ncbi:MAG: PorP/SprF family type IX secretion system membrane protein [Saprospiraceae bacterium]|jgi:type IX secretion system PorP/SprF family membrane protein|nr:PorP/SprF family type IX secretion system membrane protein [Saprospiraceae bacterium]
MKKILLLLIIFSATLSLSAQDEAIFNQYHLNPILVNPAYAGFERTPRSGGIGLEDRDFLDVHLLQANYSGQWSGFAGAPKTYMLSYHGPVGRTFGLGVSVGTETAAQIRRFKGQLNYAFRFSIKDVRFTTGFSTEIQQMTVDNAVTENPLNALTDDILDEFLNGKRAFDASLGIMAEIKQNTLLGISFANLVRARLDDISENQDESFFSYYTFFARHRFIVAGPDFELVPSMMIRQLRDAPFQIDFNLMANFRVGENKGNKLAAGLSYRFGDLGILLGFNVFNIDVYYGYDVSFRRFQKFNMGSHEITIAYRLTNDKSSSSSQK